MKTLAASATASLPEGARAVKDVGLKGSGGDDGMRACDNVGRQRHIASPGGSEGRTRRGPQGRRRQRWQEGMQRRGPHGKRRLSRCWETKLTGLPSIKDTYR